MLEVFNQGPTIIALISWALDRNKESPVRWQFLCGLLVMGEVKRMGKPTNEKKKGVKGPSIRFN